MSIIISNYFETIIGVLGGAICSFIISAFFYYLSVRKKKLMMDSYKTYSMSSKLSDRKELKKEYSEKELQSLFDGKIVITNKGIHTIEGDDFAKKDPISAVITGNGYTASTNHISIEEPDKFNIHDVTVSTCGNKYLIKFDYLKPNESFCVNVLHFQGDLCLYATLKDGNVIDYKKEKIKQIRYWTYINLLAAVLLLLFPIFPNNSFAGFLGAFIISMNGLNIYMWVKNDHERRQRISSIHRDD